MKTKTKILGLALAASLSGCAGSTGRVPAPPPAAATPVGTAGSVTAPATTPEAEAHWAALKPLGALEVAFVHQQLADEPEPTEALASALPGVCGITDDAKKQEALEGAFARVSDGIKEAVATRRWRIQLTTELGGYDFPHAGFLTGLTEDAGPTYGRGDYCWQPVELSVVLQNWSDYALVAVPRERAIPFARGNQQRVVQQELEVEVVGARAGPPKAVVVRILRLRLKDAVSGAWLADTGLR
jgi:hypothetical protein